VEAGLEHRATKSVDDAGALGDVIEGRSAHEVDSTEALQ
jgi:hypothetical protein